MKKFLKFLLIIILVCVSIGGTTYFFFSRLKPDVDNFSQINIFVSGAEKTEFDAKLDKVADFSDGDSLLKRFNLIKDVNVNLNDSLQALSGYLLLTDEYGFNNNKINKNFINLTSSRNKVQRIMDEYLTKIPGIPTGNSLSTPANDVYVAFADYFKKYSNFLKLLNNELKEFGLNKNADLKFSLIEIYANGCNSAFLNLTLNNNLVVLEETNERNIRYLNTCLNLNHSFITTKNSKDFSYLNNQFIRAYNNCDEVNFAKNIYVYVKSVDKINSNLSSELITAAYFKEIFGV